MPTRRRVKPKFKLTHYRNVSRDTVANIEGGRRWVADSELLTLAEVLGVEVQDLLPKRK